MNLSECEIRPGEVVKIVNNYGKIKASSPGLFSVDDDPDLLPPCIPFIQLNASSFSSVKIGDPIWIIRDRSNTQLFFYIKIFQLPSDVKTNILNDSQDKDILFYRDTDNGIYQIFFNGEIIKLTHDDAYIAIDKDNNINISNGDPDRTISISSDCICLGKKSGDTKQAKPVAYGDEVENCLNQIYDILNELKSLASANTYTYNLTTAFLTLPQLEKDIEKISSDDVKTV